MNHLHATKIVRVMNAQAAGTADTLAGTGVDTKGFDAVEFVALLGAITATGTATLKAQQSDDDGVADGYSDLLGTGVAAADDDDNKLLRLDVNDPLKRYVRPALVRATANVVVDGIIAVLYKADEEPVTQHGTVAASEWHHAPEEGTA